MKLAEIAKSHNLLKNCTITDIDTEPFKDSFRFSYGQYNYCIIIDSSLKVIYGKGGMAALELDNDAVNVLKNNGIIH